MSVWPQIAVILPAFLVRRILLRTDQELRNAEKNADEVFFLLAGMIAGLLIEMTSFPNKHLCLMFCLLASYLIVQAYTDWRMKKLFVWVSWLNLSVGLTGYLFYAWPNVSNGICQMVMLLGISFLLKTFRCFGDGDIRSLFVIVSYEMILAADTVLLVLVQLLMAMIIFLLVRGLIAVGSLVRNTRSEDKQKRLTAALGWHKDVPFMPYMAVSVMISWPWLV